MSIREALLITVMHFEPRLESDLYDPDPLPWNDFDILEEILETVGKYHVPLPGLSDTEFMLAFFLNNMFEFIWQISY